MYLKYILVLVILTGYKQPVECAKILGVFHMSGPSHYLAGSSLMKILAKKGHDVTIVAAFGEENPPPNYKQVVLTGQYEQLTARRPDFFKSILTTFNRPFNFNKMSINLIENMFNHSEFKEFIRSNQTFDVVIVEEFQSEAVKYLAYHFKAPLIVFNSMDTNEWTNPYQGNPDSPAYIPNVFHKFSCKMSFFERLHNTLYYVYSNLVRVMINIPMHNRLVQKYFPGAPHINEFIYNVSLGLLNADDSVHSPVPKVPSMVNIGGFHLKDPKPLPKEIQDVLDNSKNGVIYFSLGSTVDSTKMSKEKLDMLLRVFSKLKETVLWKYENEEMTGKPANVIVKKWFPQRDIFAHKNVKLFITHGGLFGIMEAIYHGIPMLSFPIFAEQHMNSVRAETNGYAKYIPFHELTEEKMMAHLKELLENQKYKEKAMERSQIMKDKPLSPNETVNFWVEYVIRHKGAPHLRMASLDLEWYQYLLLDVVIFIFAVIFSLFYIIRTLFRFLLKNKRTMKEKSH